MNNYEHNKMMEGFNAARCDIENMYKLIRDITNIIESRLSRLEGKDALNKQDLSSIVDEWHGKLKEFSF